MSFDLSHFGGPSYYVSLHGCLRRASLPGDQDATEDTEFGTQFHRFAEWYHGDRSDPPPVLSTIRPTDKAGRARGCSESELASRYADRFPPDIWGRVVLKEARLKGRIAGEPAEGGLDLVGSFDQAAVDRFAAIRGVQLEVGEYLIDYKTKSRRSETLVQGFAASPQFPQYHDLFAQNFGRSLRGTLVQVIFRYTEDRDDAFQTILLPPPSVDQQAMLRTLVREGAARLRQFGPDHCTPTPQNCFAYNRECPVLGICSRHNEEGLDKAGAIP